MRLLAEDWLTGPRVKERIPFMQAINADLAIAYYSSSSAAPFSAALRFRI